MVQSVRGLQSWSGGTRARLGDIVEHREPTVHDGESRRSGAAEQHAGADQPVLRRVLEAASERAVPTTLTKATLTELCHTLEDQVLHEDLAGAIVSGFQFSRYWEIEQDRYARLCEDPRRKALVFAADAPTTVTPDGVTAVAVGADHPLAREWFVLALTERFSAALFGRELTGPQDAPEHERAFLTVWSFDPIVVGELLALLEEAVGDLDDRVGAALAAAVERHPPRRPATGSLPRFGNLVFERLEAKGDRWRQASTELERTNQELRHSRTRWAELHQRATLGTVAGQLAHRLNNPLSAITLAADTLRSSDDPAERERLLSVIEQQALQAGELAAQLKGLASPGPIDLVEVELGSWLASEVTGLQLSGFEVISAIQGNGTDQLHLIDPERLAQALLETVRVAHEAASRSRPVEVRLRCSSTHGHILVEHDGAPPADPQLAALRTWGGSEDLTDRSATSLAAARSHLEAQAGALTVEVGEDDLVRFVLVVGTVPAAGITDAPATAGEPGAPTASDAPSTDAPRGTQAARQHRAVTSTDRHALIVDDEPAIRGLLEALLRRAGWQVRTASSLASATRQLADRGVEVLLLDLGLCDRAPGPPLTSLETVDPGISERTVLLAADPPSSRTFDGHPVAAKPFIWAELERAIASVAPGDVAAL